MTLAAADVVDALAARLGPVVLSGGRVYTSRTWPLTEAGLPAWRVTAADESVTRQYVGQTINEHLLQVECAGFVRAAADLDDAMHNLAEQGLTALFANPQIYDLQLDSISRSTATEGEAAVGVITLGVTARFAVDATAPGTLLT
jgi:hypothetical protein